MEYLKNILSGKKNTIKKLKGKYADDPGKINHQINHGTSGKPEIVKKLSQYLKSGRVNIIAEIKKASPSKGLINDFTDIKDIASIYDKHKSFIRGISVLTEETYFKGKTGYINDVKKISELPVIRKDFIFHELQVYESFAIGTDCILLISSILGLRKLGKLYRLATGLGMEAIVEVHSIRDLIKTLETGAHIIGINNRDLKKMKVDRDNVFRIFNFAKSSNIKDKIFICESGIGSKGIEAEVVYIKKLFNEGINNFLIGTYFMQSPNLNSTLKELETILKNNNLT